MAYTLRTRKRVRAIRRAPDGSAFQNCNMCGVSVAISLADMHECEPSQEVKRFKGIRAGPKVREGRFPDQPRSAFCFFMEKFKKTRENGDSIEIDRKGFETWKNMSTQERQPYLRRAAWVNSAYDKALLEEPKDEANAAVLDPWEDCSDSGWHTYVPEDEDNAAINGTGDSWEDCSVSGWRTYVPEEEEKKAVVGKSDPWEDCSGSGWHTYVPEDDPNKAVDGKCDPWEDNSGSGWHTYVPEDEEVDPMVVGNSDPHKGDANAGAAVVDPWEDCSGSGWHTYVPEEVENKAVDGESHP